MSAIASKVSELLPGGSRFFAEHGELALAGASRRLNRAGPRPSDAAIAAVLKELKAVYGPGCLPAARASLLAGAPLLSANHHGFDTHPELVQAVLIFALARRDEAGTATADPGGADQEELGSGAGWPVLVLACGAVPLRNPTCSGGFLLGRRSVDGRRIRALAFPRSYDECLVGAAPALSRNQLESFRSRLAGPPFRRAESAAAQEALDRTAADDFYDRPNFISQAAVFNSRLWSGLTGGLNDVLYVEMESVVNDCLEADLADGDSPAARVLGEARVRERVLKRLAGQTGCWARELVDGPLSAAGLADTSRARGTVFFWEISSGGRRYSMGLDASSSGPAELVGPGRRLPLVPELISRALREGRIKPGLFLDHLILADHRLDTRGGVFLVDYLPGLLEPLAEILDRPDLAEYAGRARFLAAGALPVRSGGGDDSWQREAAAGGLELASAGPWNAKTWRSLAELSFGEIWPFTASEWYLEETRPEDRPPDWTRHLEAWRNRGRGLTLPI